MSTPHEYFDEHGHQHLASRGDNVLYRDLDWAANEADDQLPLISSIGAGPRGLSLNVAEDPSNSDETGTYKFDIVNDFEEVESSSPNLHAGKLSIVVDDGAAGSPAVNPADEGQVPETSEDSDRNINFYLRRENINKLLGTATLPKGAHGTRFYIAKSARPLEIRDDCTYTIPTKDLYYDNTALKNHDMQPLPKIWDCVLAKVLNPEDNVSCIAAGVIMQTNVTSTIIIFRTLFEISAQEFIQKQADFDETDELEVTYIKGRDKIATVNALNNKVDKVTGKGLSTNDYTTAEKNKLQNIEANAEVNVQSDWDEDNPASDAYILNKPNLNNKVDVSTNPNVVHVTDNDGNEMTKSYTSNPTAGTLLYRDEDGKAQIGDAVSGKDIVNVDIMNALERLVSIVKNTTNHTITITNADGEEIIFEYGNGGQGTSDYDDLINQPKINNIVLTGNKTSADLGLITSADLANKVDKTSTANQVYGTDGSGNQKTFRVANASTISEQIVPLTTASGQLVTATPTATTHCANKKYVDDELTDKVDKRTDVTDTVMLYGKTANGEQSTYSVYGGTDATLSAGSIPVRTSGGQISNVATPTANAHLTNKGYVDSAIAAAISANNKAIHPVGMVIGLWSNTNPATFIPGTSWVALGSGYVLRSARDTNTGGADTVTLTTAQLPAHNHKLGDNGASANTGLAVSTYVTVANQTGQTCVASTYDQFTRRGITSEPILEKTGNAGSGSSHSNLPKYQNLYFFRRSA